MGKVELLITTVSRPAALPVLFQYDAGNGRPRLDWAKLVNPASQRRTSDIR